MSKPKRGTGRAVAMEAQIVQEIVERSTCIVQEIVERSTCRVCGKRIHVMAYKATGYCSQTCELARA